MDETIITNPGETILVKIGKEKQLGFYARVIDVVADKFKRGFWVVRFYPFVPTKDFKLIEMSWKLDDQQIRGEEYTMNDVPHRLFKVEFPEDEVIEPEKMFKDKVVNHIDKNVKHPNNLSNLELVDADTPVQLPTKPKSQRPDLCLIVDNPNTQLHPTKTYIKPDLRLV